MFHPAGGQVSDITVAPVLLRRLPAPARLIGDKGYDADGFRREPRDQNTIPVIPGRANRKRPIQYDKRRYRDRWRVEDAFCRLKDFRRVATRYDKLARNFLAAVSIAAIIAHWI